MSSEYDFVADRFVSAAEHYCSGRPTYSPVLIQTVAEKLDLKPVDRVLDLGCGTAPLAIAFAPLVGHVLALDPEPEMLAVAAKASEGVGNIELVLGGSTDLGSDLGSFRAVMIGRAFHWMDREATLKALDPLVECDGAIVLLWDDHNDLPGNTWISEYRALLSRYARSEPQEDQRRLAAARSHAAVLAASSFCYLEPVAHTRRLETNAAGLVDRALSRARTNRARLGSETEKMIDEIRERAEGWAHAGVMAEMVTTHALIARRRPA